MFPARYFAGRYFARYYWPAGTAPTLPTHGRKWFVLGKVFLDSGTRYVAARDVQHPSYLYEGRVKQFGYLDRSISVPAGLYQGADCRVQIIDTERELHDILAQETPRRRFIELRMVPEGARESDYAPFGTFEIYAAEFTPGIVELTGRDITFAWRDKKIPGHINRTNFPDLMDGVDEGFIPIIFGINEGLTGSPPNPQGIFDLPRMTETRWGLSQDPIVSQNIYRKSVTDGEFALVSPGEYVVTEESHTFNGITYQLQFIDFNSPQAAGVEIRADARGIFRRDAFGVIPEAVASPLETLRNPVDFLIATIYRLLANEPRIPRFNTQSFLDVMNRLEVAITSTSPPSGYKCDRVITEGITAGELLGQFLPSFELDFYTNKAGELELGFTDESDPSRPLFSQGPVFDSASTSSLILLNSVRQRIADPTCNRLRYNFSRNYSTEEWADKSVYDNESDQIELGGTLFSPPIPQIEEGSLDMWCVRDQATADDVAVRRMNFLALGSFRIEFQVPMPEAFADLELARLVGVSTYWGLDVGGYVNKEIKVTGLTHDLDKLQTTVRGILRVPHEYEHTLGDFDTVHEMVSRPQQSSEFGDVRYHSSWIPFNPDWFQGDDVRFYLEAIASNDNLTTEYNIRVQDADTEELVANISLPPNTPAQRLTPVQFTPLLGERTYEMKLVQTAGPADVKVNKLRIRIRGADGETRLQYVLIGGGAINTHDLVFGDSRFIISGDTGYIEESQSAIFFKEAAAWATVDHWTLSTVAGNTGSLGVNSCTFALQKQGGSGDVVANVHTSELSVTEIINTDFSNVAANFDDNGEFVIFSRAAGTFANNSLLLKANLYVHLSPVTKAVHQYWSSNGQPLDGGFDPSQNVDVFHEVTGAEAGAGDEHWVLSGSIDGDVAGSSIDPVGATKDRYRTSALTLPDGDQDYSTEIRSGTGGLDTVKEYLVLKVEI